MGRNRRIARLCMSVALAGAGAVTSPWSFVHAASDLLASAAPPPADAQDPEEILFEADMVSRDYEDGPIIAEGDVRAYFGERYLRADRLIYDPMKDIVIAEGDVSITDENMETAFFGRVELSGDLRDGIAENFSALLKDNARLAAAHAIEERGARTLLSRAVYTSCDVCEHGEGKNGKKKIPTWRMKALRVTRDKERKVIRFYHAFFEIKGIPILYMPFVQVPDPSVERQSGFLPPRIGASTRLGFNIELPYYLAISNSQDATFYPKYTANDGVLWQGEYRRRGNRGYHVLAGGVIDAPNQPDPAPGAPGQPFVESAPGVRWHYFGRGYRNFGENWRVSYDFERVSDDDYLKQYDVERRGDLRQELNRGRTNQLRSNTRVAWRKGPNELTFDTYLFQGLRPPDPNLPVQIETSNTPYVLPLINYRRQLNTTIAGGRTSIGANIASLYRTGGTDSQRFTASANWDRDVITRNGHRFTLFAELRGDAFFFQDLDQGTEILPGISGDTTRFVSRFASTAGVEWSFPVARDIGNARLLLEPRIQLVASPSNIDSSNIINEDSQSIEFDFAGLFDFNKATGYDAFEDGQRMNVGISASAVMSNGVTLEASIGQQYRIQSTDAFDSSVGLGKTQSDIVGSLDFKYKSHLGIENRFRIDNDTGQLQRAESMAFFRTGPLNGAVSYVRLVEENALSNLVRREELTARGRLKLSEHWSVGGAWRLDLEGKRTIRQDFTIGYEDECSTFGITYRRDRTRSTTLEPDNAVLLSFTLKTLAN